jgi:hypothetical protein
LRRNSATGCNCLRAAGISHRVQCHTNDQRRAPRRTHGRKTCCDSSAGNANSPACRYRDKLNGSLKLTGRHQWIGRLRFEMTSAYARQRGQQSKRSLITRVWEPCPRSCLKGRPTRAATVVFIPRPGARSWSGVSDPEFGIKARLPLVDSSDDATEIDMRIGSHLFEAKLTERDFTSASRTHTARYRDLELCFDISALPVKGDDFAGYQLIRNVLAAAHHNASLTILLDQRRPDLLQEWWSVHSAIQNVDLRIRCGVRTWQEIAAASPPPLAQFLSAKYGL